MAGLCSTYSGFFLEQLLELQPSPPHIAAVPTTNDPIADLQHQALYLIRGLFSVMTSDERLAMVETSNQIAQMIMRTMRDVPPGTGIVSGLHSDTERAPPFPPSPRTKAPLPFPSGQNTEASSVSTGWIVPPPVIGSIIPAQGSNRYTVTQYGDNIMVVGGRMVSTVNQ